MPTLNRAIAFMMASRFVLDFVKRIASRSFIARDVQRRFHVSILDVKAIK